MQLTLKVNQGEGDYEVTTNLYVIVAWERRFKRKASNIADAGIGIDAHGFEMIEQHRSRVPGCVVRPLGHIVADEARDRDGGR